MFVFLVLNIPRVFLLGLEVERILKFRTCMVRNIEHETCIVRIRYKECFEMRFSVFAKNYKYRFWSLLLCKRMIFYNLCVITVGQLWIRDYFDCFHSWRTLSIRHELRWPSSSTSSNSAPSLTGTHHRIFVQR